MPLVKNGQLARLGALIALSQMFGMNYARKAADYRRDPSNHNSGRFSTTAKQGGSFGGPKRAGLKRLKKMARRIPNKLRVE
jgi:hypothetical protein